VQDIWSSLGTRISRLGPAIKGILNFVHILVHIHGNKQYELIVYLYYILIIYIITYTA